MLGRFTFSTLHVCGGADVSVCVPLLWIVIMTMASSSEISSVSYMQSGYGHLCLGIVVNSEREIYCFGQWFCDIYGLLGAANDCCS